MSGGGTPETVCRPYAVEFRLPAPRRTTRAQPGVPGGCEATLQGALKAPPGWVRGTTPREFGGPGLPSPRDPNAPYGSRSRAPKSLC